MTSDEKYMLRCLELAQKGVGFTSPNPLVGAVLVYKERIIGEGWHRQYGHPHAEVNCLESVRLENKNLIPKSRLYVNLEPCSHFGKTPPCCDRIIKEKIQEVVVGCIDSNKVVAGQGIQQMKSNGIHVTVGVLESECRFLNRRFFIRQEQQRPYIILKWAQTANGFIADNSKQHVQISDWPETRAIHKMRFEEDAILVGYQTALKDNPKLSNRHWKSGRQPLRVLIDNNNDLPNDFYLKDNQQATLIFNYQKEGLENKISWRLLQPRQSIAQQVVEGLHEINSLIVEGGSKTLQAFIDKGLWDEAHVWISQTKVMSGGVMAPILAGVGHVEKRLYGNDLLARYCSAKKK